MFDQKKKRIVLIRTCPKNMHLYVFPVLKKDV